MTTEQKTYQKQWRAKQSPEWHSAQKEKMRLWRVKNLEYAREQGKTKMRKYRCTDKYKKAHVIYKEKKGIIDKDQVKCVECGLVFTREAAQLRGYKFFQGAGNRVLCSDC